MWLWAAHPALGSPFLRTSGGKRAPFRRSSSHPCSVSGWWVTNHRSEVYAPVCVAEVAEQGMNPLRLHGLHCYHSRNLCDLLVHFSDGNVSRASIFDMIFFFHTWVYVLGCTFSLIRSCHMCHVLANAEGIMCVHACLTVVLCVPHCSRWEDRHSEAEQPE